MTRERLTKRIRSVWMIALVVVIAIGATAAWFFRRTDTRVTPLGIDEALALVVDATAPSGTSGGNGPALVGPEPGVYVYTTVGRESIDALAGASHDYPATTTMVVTAAPCGVVQRWLAAAERYDDFGSCPTAAADGSPGVLMDRYVEYHQFFGVSNLEAYDCQGEPRPLGAAVGTTWSVTCERDGETGVWTGEVLEATTLTVGGVEVDVEHVVVTVDNGDPEDRQRHETWYLAGTDLAVRRITDVATVEPSPIGTVHYEEHYQIDLVSLTPEQFDAPALSEPATSGPATSGVSTAPTS